MPMPPTMPMPGVMGPGPIPGVSDTAPAPQDRMAELAEMLGQVKGDDEVSAAQDFTQALGLMESAAKKDPRILPLYQKIMAVLNETAAPPQGPPPSGLMGAIPPGAGVPAGPLPAPGAM